MRALAAAALFALLLAGCSDPAPAPEAGAAPTVITDPAQGLDDRGAHVHDYWRGGDRLTVLQATHPGGDEPGTGPGLAGGQDVVVRSFQPDSGNVVPQGTAAVEVTLSWADAELDSYAAPSLWMKTAAQDATMEAAAVENGVPATIEVGAPDADLPHQLLSAWLFELRMGSPDPMPLRFKGAVTIQVDAVRGLPLPVFPAHPDLWQGARELPLLDAAGTLSYFEDLGDGGCNGLACPQVLRPAPGRLVPGDAAAVRVVLAVAGGAGELGLHYHGALQREFQPATPLAAQGGVLTYELPVDGGGDGPYATQSQWEFLVLPDAVGPLRTAWMAEYEIQATAVR